MNEGVLLGRVVRDGCSEEGAFALRPEVVDSRLKKEQTQKLWKWKHLAYFNKKNKNYVENYYLT